MKYLGVTLDSKLSMNEHAKVLKNKASRALWAAASLCRRNWGLKPENMFYIYNSILLPRILYGCLVFWHRFADQGGNKARLKILRTIQRRATMMIAGASRNAPSILLLALLNITPIEILMEKYAMSAMLRLRLNGVWKDRGAKEGHCKISRNLVVSQLHTDVSTISPRWRTHRAFDISITIRLQFKSAGGIDYFSDASVKEDDCGIGWVRLNDGHREGFGRTLYSCDSYRAEIIALKTAVEHALSTSENGKRFDFWTDSLRCVEALKKPLTGNKDTWECSKALNELAGKKNRVRVLWISKKAGADGLSMADSLAKKGRLQELELIRNLAPVSLNRQILEEWESEKKRAVWNKLLNSNGYQTSKLLLNGFDDPRFKTLPGLGKRKMRMVTALTTGAAPLNGFLSKIKRSDNKTYSDLCRFCKDAKEDILHLLGDCLHWTLRSARLKAFGSMDIKSDRLNKLDLKTLIAFGTEIKLAELILIRRTEDDELMSSSDEADLILTLSDLDVQTELD